MRAEYSEVLLQHFSLGLPAGRQSADAHPYDVFFQIRYRKIAVQEIAEQKIGVGCDVVGLVVDSFPCCDLTAYVACGVEG